MTARIGNRRLIGQMNMVPFIDVMLVLLVAFMITAPLISAGVQIEFAKGAAPEIDPGTLKSQLVLTIDADGNLYLNVGEEPEQPIDGRVVMALASAVLRQDPSTPVFIRADQSASYGQYIQGQTLLTESGASTVVQVIDSSEYVDE